MNAIWRLNLLVAGVFIVALCITVLSLVKQAGKDIEREVTAGVSFTLNMLPVIEHTPNLLEPFLNGHTRHVSLTVNESWAPEHLEAPPQSHEGDEDAPPRWFLDWIPEVAALEDQFQIRFLPDGRELRVQADPTDEASEIWETVQLVVALFVLAMLLTMSAIWLGVRQGLKPVAECLQAMKAVGQGHLDARLKDYSLPELNAVSHEFNAMAMALENAEHSNQALTRKIMTVQEGERAHLARELHDDVGQYATGIRAQAYLMTQLASVPGQGATLATTAHTIVQHCESMQQSFRRLIENLHPVILDQLPVEAAIKTLIEQWQKSHGVDVAFHSSDALPRLSDDANRQLYRCAQEALTNVAKHSGATQVGVSLCLDSAKRQLILTVQDNGLGLEAKHHLGLGMYSLKERARLLGGECDIESTPRVGVNITIRVPVQPNTEHMELTR